MSVVNMYNSRSSRMMKQVFDKVYNGSTTAGRPRFKEEEKMTTFNKKIYKHLNSKNLSDPLRFLSSIAGVMNLKSELRNQKTEIMGQFEFHRGTQKQIYLIQMRLKTKEFVLYKVTNGKNSEVLRGTDLNLIKKSLIN